MIMVKENVMIVLGMSWALTLGKAIFGNWLGVHRHGSLDYLGAALQGYNNVYEFNETWLDGILDFGIAQHFGTTSPFLMI